MAAVFGGDPGRTSFHRIHHEFAGPQDGSMRGTPSRRGNQPLQPKRVELPAGHAAIVPVHGALIAVASAPGQLFRIPLRATGPSFTRSPLTIAPKTKLPDCVAAFGDTLFVLHEKGASARCVAGDDSYPERGHVDGSFCAQVVTEQGWLLVETNGPDSVLIHRLTHDGDPLNRAIPHPVPRRSYEEWALPVADSNAAYMLDDEGWIWRFPWDGSPASRIGQTEPGRATLMHTGNALFVLPIGDDRQPQRVNPQTGEVQPVALARPRLHRSAAADLRNMAGRLWLGLTATDGIQGVSIAQPAQRPVPASSRPVVAHELAVLADANGEGLLLGLTEGEAGYRLRGWWLDQQHAPAPPMEPPHPREEQCARGPHLTVAEGHACVWYCTGGKTHIFMYELT